MRLRSSLAALGVSLLVAVPGVVRAYGAGPATELPTRSRLPITGDRIRLTPRDGSDPIIGMVQAASPDSLWFTAESGDRLGSRTVSWTSLRMAELSVGKRGHVVEGLFIGLAAGVGLGLLSTSGRRERTGDAWADFGSSIGDAMRDAVAVVLCGVGGLAAGAMIGGEFKSDRWECVLPRPASFEHGQTPGPD